MVDAVTSQTLQDGERNVTMKFTNISDGTGEAAVAKVDVSALAANGNGDACTGVVIKRMTGFTFGMGVDLLWDATANVLIHHIPADTDFDLDFEQFGGIPNNAGAGITGDLLLTTLNHTAADRYSFILEMVKKYD